MEILTGSKVEIWWHGGVRWVNENHGARFIQLFPHRLQSSITQVQLSCRCCQILLDHRFLVGGIHLTHGGRGRKAVGTDVEGLCIANKVDAFLDVREWQDGKAAWKRQISRWTGFSDG